MPLGRHKHTHIKYIMTNSNLVFSESAICVPLSFVIYTHNLENEGCLLLTLALSAVNECGGRCEENKAG